MTNLYIHIGMPKAGSTSIQAAFASGREELAKHGVAYFSLGQNNSGVLRSMFDDSDRKGLPGVISKTLGVERRSTDFDKAALADLFDRALTADRMPKLVMSGEGLFQFDPEHIERMREHLSRFFSHIRIIAYIRDPISWASSRAQNAVKNSMKTLDQICDPHAVAARNSVIVPQYRAGIEPYIEAFGREAVDIRVFDRGRLVNGDVVPDFCVAIDEPGLAADLSGAVMNPSLSYETVLLIDEYKKRVAAHDGGGSRTARVRQPDIVEFRKRVEGLVGTRFALPRETLERVWTAVADDLNWLREVMKEDVFGEPSYPPEATAGPVWSSATLRGLLEVIEGGVVLSAAPEKRNRRKLQQTVEGVADASGDRRRTQGLPEDTIQQIREAFGGPGRPAADRSIQRGSTGQDTR